MKKQRIRAFLLTSAVLLSWVTQPATAPCAESPQMAAMMLSPDNPFPPITKERDSLQPYITHPDQVKEAANKLEALEKKFGKKPNIVVLLVDDMGGATRVALAGARLSVRPHRRSTGWQPRACG